jgi:SAM-dependent methyltransferase
MGANVHKSSFHRMGEFVKLVRDRYQGKAIRVLDIGSMGINGTYKELFQFEGVEYVGLDADMGPNVDIVPKDSYNWNEIEDESFDVIVSGQVLEHVEFPWLTVEQVAKKLKFGGLACLIAPSRGPEHRYPHDCYRYYPDGMRALIRWAGLTAIDVGYEKNQTGFHDGSDQWGDCYGILTKKEAETAVKDSLPQRKVPESPVVPMTRHRANPLQTAKTDIHFQQQHQESIELIKQLPIEAKRVLELGCTNGETGKALKELWRTERYEGVEASYEMAERARLWLDAVHVADIEKSSLESLGIKKNEFDLLLALGVMQRFFDPWETLVKFIDCVRPGGFVVLSVPNVSNLAVLEELVQNKWQYGYNSLRDPNDIRCFTLTGIQALVCGAGLEIISQAIVAFQNPSPNAVLDHGNSIRLGKLELHDLSRDDVAKLFAKQYVIVARKQLER